MVLLSIVVPVYNTSSYLVACFESIRNQNFKDFEVIIVDDGSTDDSPSICQYYHNIDSRFHYFRKPNGGQSSARNYGFLNSSGKYIYFLDSDDYILPGLFSSVIDRMDKFALDVCLFSADTELESGYVDPNLFSYKKSYSCNKVSGITLFKELLRRSEYTVQPCMYFLRKDFAASNNILFIEGIYYEDNIYTFDLLTKAQYVGCITDIYYVRRIRSGSTMTDTSNPDSHISSIEIVIDSMLQRVSGDYVIDKYIRSSIYYFIDRLFYFLSSNAGLGKALTFFCKKKNLHSLCYGLFFVKCFLKYTLVKRSI